MSLKDKDGNLANGEDLGYGQTLYQPSNFAGEKSGGKLDFGQVSQRQLEAMEAGFDPSKVK